VGDQERPRPAAGSRAGRHGVGRLHVLLFPAILVFVLVLVLVLVELVLFVLDVLVLVVFVDDLDSREPGPSPRGWTRTRGS